MNGAQRAAFVEMLRYADQMSNMCFNLEQRPSVAQEDWNRYRVSMRETQRKYDAARDRYFELEREAKQLRLTAQQMAGKSSARKSG